MCSYLTIAGIAAAFPSQLHSHFKAVLAAGVESLNEINMNDKEMTKEIAKSAHAFAIPIDFEKLITAGLLIKKGKSYYAADLKALPDIVSKRIKTVTPTKNGLRITFYKESKSLKKIAESLRNYLE